MAFNRSDDTVALTPDEHGDMYFQPLTDAAVALQVTNNIRTTAAVYRVPVVTSTPRASWTAEGAEISLSDPGVNEVSVRPSKVAALNKMSRELLDDSGGQASGIVSMGMVADVAACMDEAFFGDPGDSEAPSGLRSLTDHTTIYTGEAWANVDAFAEALSLAEGEGVRVNSFVANPATVLALQQVKESDGSNRPLLGADVNSPTSRSVLGVPLFTSRFVEDDVVWALPRNAVHSIIRTPAELAVSADAAFSSYSVMVRIVQRAGFLFPHQEAVVKISTAASSA